MIIKGAVQKYDNGRKKIEVKKELKQIFDILEDSSLFYVMEYHLDIEKAINRLREIYQETKQLPVFLNFQKIMGEQNGNNQEKKEA